MRAHPLTHPLPHPLTHLSDAALTRELATVVSRARHATATVVAHIAEFDARRLYLPAGYPSMLDYCVGELRFSEDAAYKRIRAARAARQFPAIFDALADGRLHLTAVVRLKPHLTPANVDDLLAAATHKSKAEVEQLLADRFPRSELLPWVHAVAAPAPVAHAAGGVGTSASGSSLVPEPVGALGSPLVPEPVGALGSPLVPEPVGALGSPLVPEPVDVAPRSRVAPLAPTRYALQATIGQDTHELLRYAQTLLGHQVSSGDLATVFHLGIEALVDRLEKRKFAATARPRRSARPSADPRHIPARVKRAVWERDRGRCTFVGDGGHRCEARERLEFDHIEPVARGGRSTVENLRLRCRGHNQYEAERAFGADFMEAKREAAWRGRADGAATRERAAGNEPAQAAEAAQAQAVEDVQAQAVEDARERAAGDARVRPAEDAPAQAAEDARAQAAEDGQVQALEEARTRAVAEQQARDVMTCLTRLGFREREARGAMEFSGTVAGAGLEERVRAALGFLCPRARVVGRVETSLGAAT